MSGTKQYKYIDLEFINEMADGDNDFLVNAVDIYLNLIPRDVEKLLEASAAQNATDIIFCAHKLKGSFQFIGCTSANDAFETIELNCKTGAAMDEISGLVASVREAAEGILEELIAVREDAKG